MKIAKILFYIVMVITVLVAIVPMQLTTVWDDPFIIIRNQYEVMTDSILERHLYLDEEVSEDLLALDNPYDFFARDKGGIDYLWDHAFYNGRYYMYFGIVPVFTVFLPYRFITGQNLVGFQATQIFTAFFIFGLFALFRLFRKLFFKKMPFYLYLLLSVGFSLISVWLISATPSLYCTPIAAGICFGTWSILCFIKAVFDSKKESEELLYLTLGSLCGALVFGCRPPIAMFNVILLPILYLLVKKREFNKKRAIKLLLALLPYVIIGILLMLYNYARFDNPFEFGQAYQLTVTDQHNYSIWNNFDVFNVFCYYYGMLFEFRIEYVINRGVFFAFPILFLGIIGLCWKKVRNTLKKKKLSLIVLFMIIGVLITIFTIAIYSPYMIPRYRMDVLWLLSIITFLIIGLLYNNVKHKKLFTIVLIVLSILMIVMAIRLFCTPFDLNYANYIKNGDFIINSKR